MIENLFGISFLYPWAFLLLLLYIGCHYLCKENSQRIYFSNIAMLVSATQHKTHLIVVIRFLVFFFLVVALANPVLKESIGTNENKGYEIALILDTSSSMLENNKFATTKEIVADFIQKRGGDRLALGVFADFPYIAVPMTYDKNSLSNLLRLLEVGVAGGKQTALYEALFHSSELFKTSKSANKIVILLTDGDDNTNTIPLDLAIERANKYGIKVYTIGIGEAGEFNLEALSKIATSTEGKFFAANSKEKIQAIYNTINTLEKSDIKTDHYTKKTYLYQYPLDIALGLLFLLLVFGRRSL